jgi:membrane protein DedA with SNARE-associated domain
MEGIAEHLVRHGAALVFANVFVQQIGVPVPAEPILLVSGSLVTKGLLSLVRVVAATVAASALADTIWFLSGRRFGPALRRVLRRRSAVRSHEPADPGDGRFERWGLRALLVARFLPGATQLIVSMVGDRRVPFPIFLLYDLAGILLWAALPIVGGMLLHGRVEAVLHALSGGTVWGLLAAAGVVAIVYYRQRYVRRGARVSAARRA